MARDNFNTSGIYIIQCDQYIYIGKGVIMRKRIEDHKRKLSLNTHQNSYLQRVYNKHNNIDFCVLEYAERDNLAAIEMQWIEYFNYIGAFVVNLTRGGEGCLGRKVSKETLEKIKKAHIGKKRSLQARENMRNAHLGKKQSSESVAKRVVAMTGQKRTQETCRKLGAVHARIYKAVLISPDGTEYTDIYNLTQFALLHNLDRRTLNAVMLGDKKSYKKWRLKT